MKFGRKSARLLVVASLTAGGLVASSAPAQADFHLMKVREVSTGTGAQPNADFVELQMTSPFQTNVSGHLLHLYGAPTYPGEPSSRTDCTLPTDVTNSADNARILFATTDFQSVSPVDPDFTIPPLLAGPGGAVCFENIDCVSWGSFSGTTTSPAGTPFPGGIVADMSIDRKATGDEPQDTDISADDFEAQPPEPVANIPAPTPQATICQVPPPAPGTPGGEPIVQGLKAKVKGNKAIISGQIAPPAPGEKVSLTFFANGSPLKKFAKKTAELNADSRFKKKFKIPSASTRCKVKVAFKGDNLGKKKFKC